MSIHPSISFRLSGAYNVFIYLFMYLFIVEILSEYHCILTKKTKKTTSLGEAPFGSQSRLPYL